MALSDDDIEKHFKTAVETLRSDTHSKHLRDLLARLPEPNTGEDQGDEGDNGKPPAPPKKDKPVEPEGETARKHWLFGEMKDDYSGPDRGSGA